MSLNKELYGISPNKITQRIVAGESVDSHIIAPNIPVLQNYLIYIKNLAICKTQILPFLKEASNYRLEY